MNRIFDGKERRSAALQFLLVLAVCFSFRGSATAQNARDLSGIWDKPKSGRFITRDEPSMTPWALDIWKKNREGIKDANEHGRIDRDPSRWCYPAGPARILSSYAPFEIRHSTDEILLFFEEDHMVRRINTDEAEHPDGYPITWMGHSIGKWDGDTLVVETVFTNPDTWLDALGHPQSDNMKMVERFHRVNHYTLQVDATFEDSKAYTKPWTEKKTFELVAPGYEWIDKVECEEWLAMEKPRRPEKKPQDIDAMFDKAHPMTLTGTVTDIDFSGPRVEVRFEVKDKNGATAKWTALSASPGKVYRAGWNIKSLKPGDSITVAGLPAKDGTKNLSVRKLTAPGGKTLNEGAED